MALQTKFLRKRGQATQKGYFLKIEKEHQTMKHMIPKLV